MISNIIDKKYLIIIGLIIITLAIIHLYSQQIEIVTSLNKLSKKCDDALKKSELNNTEIFLIKQANIAKPTDTLYEMSYNSKEETPIQCEEVLKPKENSVHQESVNVDVSQLITKITDKNTEDDLLDSLIKVEVKQKEIKTKQKDDNLSKSKDDKLKNKKNNDTVNQCSRDNTTKQTDDCGKGKNKKK